MNKVGEHWLFSVAVGEHSDFVLLWKRVFQDKFQFVASSNKVEPLLLLYNPHLLRSLTCNFFFFGVLDIDEMLTVIFAADSIEWVICVALGLIMRTAASCALLLLLFARGSNMPKAVEFRTLVGYF